MTNKRIKRYFSGTFNNHRKRGYLFNFTKDELLAKFETQEICLYCHKLLKWDNNKIKDNSPSLDRINNELILNLDSVQLLCNECNLSKNNRSTQQFVEYAQKICIKFKDVYHGFENEKMFKMSTDFGYMSFL